MRTSAGWLGDTPHPWDAAATEARDEMESFEHHGHATVFWYPRGQFDAQHHDGSPLVRIVPGPEEPLLRRSAASIKNMVDRVRPRGRGGSPSGTTPSQLRAATVRGGISAFEELEELARARREQGAARYRASEAVRAANAAAALRGDVDDEGFWTDRSSSVSSVTIAPLQRVASEGNMFSVAKKAMRRKSSDACRVSGGDRNGSKMRMPPWDAMQSASGSFLSRRKSTTKKEEVRADEYGSMLKKKVAEMQRKILVASHNQAGGLLERAAEAPDSKARARVKMIVEQPEQASAYITLGLSNDPSMDVLQLIRMLDYYLDD